MQESDDLGLSRHTVRLAEHNPRWAEHFEREKEILFQALGTKVLEIRHMGSTAVPGMPAKPIIDMLAAVKHITDVESFTNTLAGLGYEDKGEAEVPGRRYFVKGTESARTHHLNFYELGSPGWTTHIQFCEYLKSHPEAATEYANLKIRLAKEFPHDRAAYTSAKEAFVTRILTQAKGTTEENS